MWSTEMPAEDCLHSPAQANRTPQPIEVQRPTYGGQVQAQAWNMKHDLQTNDDGHVMLQAEAQQQGAECAKLHPCLLSQLLQWPLGDFTAVLGHMHCDKPPSQHSSRQLPLSFSRCLSLEGIWAFCAFGCLLTHQQSKEHSPLVWALKARCAVQMFFGIMYLPPFMSPRPARHSEIL